jgi:hypothetical protein
MASQSHRICVADSSSCRHLSQIGSSGSPSLKRCPLRWQCPVSTTTRLSWSLISSNRSFVRLAEGPDMNLFACLSPIMASRWFLWLLFVQSLTAFLATPVEMPQAGSSPMNGFSDPLLASDLPFHCHQYPHDLPPISAELLLCSASCMRDWWQSKINFEVIWCLPSVLITA